MIFIKESLTVLVWVSLCMANISGIIISASGGSPITGAVVRLEKGGQMATSGPNGFFTLTVEGTGILPSKDKMFSNGLYAKISGDRVIMSIEKKTAVEIKAFDFSGRTVFTICKTLDAGNQSIALPQQGKGIYLYKVKTGGKEFVLKGNTIGGVSHERSTITGESFSKSLLKQVKSTMKIDDVIAVTNEGYLNYRSIIGYSESEIIIKMIVNAGNVTDADGNVYKSVRIGNQVWMAENLRTTRYNDGTAIPLDTSVVTWDNATSPKYCFYNNTTNTDSIKKYGALYNGYVIDPANPMKVAPEGWHVPSTAEWDVLQNYLIAEGYNWDGTTTDNKIAKSLAVKADWVQNSTDGSPGNDLALNNRSGFSALAGGGCGGRKGFSAKSYYGTWWSTTGYDISIADAINLTYGDEGLYVDSQEKWVGYSVRLVKD